MLDKHNPKFKKSFELYDQARQRFPYGTQLFSRRPELGPFGQAPVYFEKAKNDVSGMLTAMNLSILTCPVF